MLKKVLKDLCSYIKILTSVYLDVFIRVAALSFAMFMLRYLNAFDMEQFLMANDLLDKGLLTIG